MSHTAATSDQIFRRYKISRLLLSDSEAFPPIRAWRGSDQKVRDDECGTLQTTSVQTLKVPPVPSAETSFSTRKHRWIRGQTDRQRTDRGQIDSLTEDRQTEDRQTDRQRTDRQRATSLSWTMKTFLPDKVNSDTY